MEPLGRPPKKALQSSSLEGIAAPYHCGPFFHQNPPQADQSSFVKWFPTTLLNCGSNEIHSSRITYRFFTFGEGTMTAPNSGCRLQWTLKLSNSPLGQNSVISVFAECKLEPILLHRPLQPLKTTRPYCGVWRQADHQQIHLGVIVIQMSRGSL